MASLARPVGLPLPLLLMLGLPTALAVSPSRPFRFIPYGAAVPAHIGATISCDGKVERVEMSANHLELSHWTNNRTPDELYADLSTECAVRLAEVRLEEGRYAEVMSELTTPIAAQLPFQSPCQSPLNPPLNDPPVTCQLTSSYPPKFHPKWPPNDPQMTPQSPANHPPITPNQAPITRQSPANPSRPVRHRHGPQQPFRHRWRALRVGVHGATSRRAPACRASHRRRGRGRLWRVDV